MTNKDHTLFITLNPSTADGQQDGMATKRCVGVFSFILLL
ncbi:MULTISPECIES: DUF1643 domain-containing protein [Bacillus cereus group]|nr:MULTISPECIES: DUF1643 domain-containing protein [Bacillus cereus group]